jgi:hypothetical protein
LFQTEQGSPCNEIVTLLTYLIDSLVHQLGDTITAMTRDVLRQGATIDLTP